MDKIIERVKTFFNKGNSFNDILDGIVEKTLTEKFIVFSFGVEYDGKFVIYDEKADKWEERVLDKVIDLEHKYEQIEQYFHISKTDTGHFVKSCRCIGGFNKNMKFYVYYHIAVNDSMINPIFLCCAEREYYKRVASHLSFVLRAVPDVVVKLDYKELHHCISEEFRKYMQRTFAIDVEVITELSGINYEKESCRSNFVFLLADIEKMDLTGITFDSPIEINTGNIKKIRKLLQMGKEEQCLLAYKCGDTWQVKGLYNKQRVVEKSISFRFIDHMVWKMEVGEKLSVGYKCGEYIVEGGNFEVVKFADKYKEVFGREVDPEAEKVFKESICQKHGTILVIIQKRDDNKGAAKEIERLMKVSTGMRIKTEEIAQEFVDSATAIDGALFIDEFGKCYGFGVILDSNTTLQGIPERGARFNSTRKYIKTCKDRGMKSLGIVISEDGTINILSTEDNFSKEEKNVEDSTAR